MVFGLRDSKISQRVHLHHQLFFLKHFCFILNVGRCNKYDNKIKIIFDASLLTNISFKQVKILSIFLISMKPIHKNKLDKFAIVIVNKYVSNILNVIFVVIPPVRPYSIVNNIEEAKKYIC